MSYSVGLRASVKSLSNRCVCDGNDFDVENGACSGIDSIAQLAEIYQRLFESPETPEVCDELKCGENIMKNNGHWYYEGFDILLI